MPASLSPSLDEFAAPPRAGYLVTALLVALVLLVGGLQFRWLGQLSEQESAQRRSGLTVAAENFSAFVGRELELLYAQANEASSLADLIAAESLIEAAVAFDAQAAPRIIAGGDSDWRPASRAELQQRLGAPLVRLASAGAAGNGIWLEPLAVVVCRTQCQVGIVSPERLIERIIEPTARRTFAELDEQIAVRLTVRGAGYDKTLYVRGARPREFAVTDLSVDISPAGVVAGPPGARWWLEANHGGETLEVTMRKARTRNLLLSAGVLTLLACSIGLVVSNARRQSALARQRLFFVATVSHELRTPLTVISTAAENLADATVEDPERTRRYGTLIHDEVRRLGSMIENVLQFAQAASSAQPRAQTSLAVHELVAAVVTEHTATLAAHDLRIDVPVDLPAVRGDAAALRSVLANLLTNAARYAEGADWIRLSARAVRLRPRGRALRIDVSNPVGKLSDNPAQFFEPFYRGKNARRSGQRGTGIGLAVARHVAQQHGGGVRVFTHKPGEITFTVYLPVDENY